jgi:hypothetical protein
MVPVLPADCTDGRHCAGGQQILRRCLLLPGATASLLMSFFHYQPDFLLLYSRLPQLAGWYAIRNRSTAPVSYSWRDMNRTLQRTEGEVLAHWAHYADLNPVMKVSVS